MLEVSRKDKETVTSLLRRFQRKAQKSGLVIEARRVRYNRKPASVFKKRKSAIRRLKIRALREKLLKDGTIEEGQPVPQQLKKKWETARTRI